MICKASQYGMKKWEPEQRMDITLVSIGKKMLDIHG